MNLQLKLAIAVALFAIAPYIGAADAGGQAIVTVGTHTMVAEEHTVYSHSTELFRTAQGECADVKVEWQHGDVVLLSERVWSEDDNGIAAKLDRAHGVWRGRVCGVLYGVAETYAFPD